MILIPCYCGNSGYLEHQPDNAACPRNEEDEPMFAADLRVNGNLAEAYGRLRGGVQVAIDWLERPSELMSRAEVAQRLRDALLRAESVRNNK